MNKKDLILDAIKKFNSLAHVCNLELSDKLGMSELQLSQLHYLKIIDRTIGLTFSQFAEILSITRPSVTEIVNKLIRLDCVNKMQSQDDGRIFYIELTEKGRNMAQISSLSEERLVDIILEKLNENDIEIFISLIRKL